mgnify:CR=1 FL=1
MEIFILFGLVILFGVFMAVESIPWLDWSCVFGRHKYHYIGKKSGMALNTKKRGVIGTMRNVYECKCGKEKPAVKEDYL